MSDPLPKPTPSNPAVAWIEKLLGAPLAALLALILFGLVNFLSARHYRRFDWTRHQVFSLSERSKQIVRRINEPTDLYVLLGQGETQFSDVSELAQRYAAESSQMRVHAIDPDRQRDRFRAIAERYGIQVLRTASENVSSDAAILVTRGDRHWEIRREALAGLGDDSNPEEASPDHGATAQITVERAITEAILHIDRNEATKVCFSTGHGEVPLDGGDVSMSLLATELHHDNIVAQPVAIAGVASVPAECDALVIAGPRQPFTQGDAEIVTRYIHAGGNVMMLVDPLFGDRRYAPSGLESVAALGGIELTQTLLVETDEAHRIPDMMPVTFMASEFGEHAISRPLRGEDSRVLVAGARGLRRLSGSTVVPESLLRTTSSAYASTQAPEAFQDGVPARLHDDISGPIDIAMAAQVPGIKPRTGHGAEDPAGRLVVVGFSRLVLNRSLADAAQAQFLDGALVVLSIAWLTARHELIQIPARPNLTAALTASAADLRRLQIYTLFLVPLAALLIGVAVWRARKAQ